MPEISDADYAKLQELKAQDAANEPAKPREWYVHLADGNVVTLDDDKVAEIGTHYDGIAVIAKYEVGA